jgi:hypothetical protein
MHRPDVSRVRLVALALGLVVALLVLALIAPDVVGAMPRGY